MTGQKLEYTVYIYIFFNHFLKDVSPRLHLYIFDKKCSKNSNNVKYYNKLNALFSVVMYFVMAKLHFQQSSVSHDELWISSYWCLVIQNGSYYQCWNLNMLLYILLKMHFINVLYVCVHLLPLSICTVYIIYIVIVFINKCFIYI